MKRLVGMMGLAGLGLALALAGTASASSVVPLSLGDLVQQSDLVVEARMLVGVADWSGTPGSSVVFTYWELQVLDPVKGPAPPRFLVRVPGGRVDDRTLTVPGAPGFRANQEVVLFLKRTAEVRRGLPVYEVLGWQQGALPISADPVTGERIIPQSPLPGAPGPKKPVALKVKDLKKQIKALLAQPPGSPPKEVSP
jgi:hypothetical protein